MKDCINNCCVLMVASSSVVLLLWICQFKAWWWTNKQQNKSAHDKVTMYKPLLEYIDGRCTSFIQKYFYEQ